MTAKDFDFVYPRSRFAAGWACVSGLDIRMSGGKKFTTRPLKRLKDAL